MNNMNDKTVPARILRHRAEEKLRKLSHPQSEVHGAGKTRQLLQELRVHQIEIEMQNEELRRAQAEREASWAHYIDFYDFAPVGFITVSKTGLILEANLTATTFLGSARSALIRQPLSRFILPEDQDIYYDHHKCLFETGEPQRCELRLLRPDSLPFWVRLESISIRVVEKGSPACRVVMSDINDRKQTEMALLGEKKIIDAILDSAPGLIYLYDDQGNLVRWNKKHEEMTGYSSEELSRMNVLDWFEGDEESLSAVKEGLKKTLENGFAEAAADLQRKDGSKIPMSFTASSLITDGRPYFVGIGIDVTDRKRTDEERVLLSTVVEQTEENVIITDNRRTIIYVNPAFERSSGYRCEELRGQKLKMLRSDQHDEGFYQITKEILDRGEVWMGVIINKGKDGSNFEIEGTISPIRNAAGAVTHFIAIGRNMNRFRRLEKELQQAQKLDALGTLAGGIAHDFNNVLTAIMGLIEMESLAAGEGSHTRHRMAQALSACCHARELIQQILSFSRQSDQRHKPIEIALIVEDALKMLRATLPSRIDIRSAFNASQSVILGDPTQIRQIIVNLCTNAAHAMRATGGILEVGLDDVEVDAIKAGEHLDLHPGPHVRLVIRDTGHGMDRKTLSRIFDPFFTTKAPGEGAGIGLTVVHRIVKGHGGRIAAHSEPGKGSMFEIFFPRIQRTAASVGRPDDELETGSGRILLVDDEEMLIPVVTEMLKFLGYDVVSVRRGFDALQLFHTQRDRFHLVITDLTMPEMTGMELAEKLLRIRADIPIILSTGFTSTGLRDKAMAMGIREVLTKPFVLQELAKTVRKVLGG